MLLGPDNAAAEFCRSFEMIFANTEALRQRVYQVRHQVFCEDLGFAMQNDGKFEADEYDDQSLHCLLHHRPSNLDVGCTRLVLPRPGRGSGLPFESFGLHHVDRKLFDWKQIDPQRCCEISRLAVVPNVRRHNEQDAVDNIEEMATWSIKKNVPYIAASLYYAALTLVLQRDYRWVFMVIEPRLQRHLQRYGINVRQISPTFDYYGQRAVYVVTGRELREGVLNRSVELQSLYSNVHRQLLGRAATSLSMPRPTRLSELALSATV